MCQDELLKPTEQLKEPITLVALLGHEQERVVPFLEQHEPYFDEIVFVADGPQPECVEEIEAHVRCRESPGPTPLTRPKIRVVERALAGDFGAQRNFGQDQCRSEWVLHADLDERFDRALLESLQDIIRAMRRAGKSVCGFPRINTLDGVVVNDLPRAQWTAEGLARARSREATPLRNLDPQFRLMRRHIRWRGRVHEAPAPLVEQPSDVMLWPQAAIRHDKALLRQREQDARYEAIARGASLRPTPGREESTSRRLRLLMLAAECPPARRHGLGRYASELAEALAAIGHRVDVVTPNYEGGRPSHEQNGVLVHDLRSLVPLKHFDWVGDAVLRSVWLLGRAIEVADERGPFDLLLAHGWLGALAAKSAKSILRLPLVLFMHDTEPGKRGNRLTREQLYVAEMEAWACECADAVIAGSAFLAGELDRFHGVPAARLHVILCGVSSARFETDCCLPDFRALFATPGEKLVLCVGHLSAAQGVDLLMEAMPEILRRKPETRLLIAGEGPLRRPLEDRAKSLAVADRVVFAGYLVGKVLGAAYRAADLVVIPSRREPSAMMALEAMCCGAPLVVADTGALREITPRDGSVARFPAGSTRALVDAVCEGLSRRRTRSLTERLQAHAAKHPWQASAQRVSEVCASLLRTPREAGT